MANYDYELLRCDFCGKTLGYIHIQTKIGVPGLIGNRYWFPQRTLPQELEKTAYCETCFQKRLEKVSDIKKEPEIKKEKDETEKPRTKSRDRSLIR
jgi:hypothetical protein